MFVPQGINERINSRVKNPQSVEELSPHTGPQLSHGLKHIGHRIGGDDDSHLMDREAQLIYRYVHDRERTACWLAVADEHP